MTEEKYGTLIDGETGETIGPATREQRAASDEAGYAGEFLIDGDGDVRAANDDPEVYGPLRTVYVQP